ncbi:hypothetical protein BHY07_16875 [Bacillus subtilis subsp. subtilis]|nr:hypothetical protein M036_15800 [Bacillus subtilis TO-A]AIY94420.1 hypothetical protein QU35_16880 [Bacillus subtilis subsp. subtilis str. 168]AIY98730.1 hypothetical protein QX56_16870 [Bacillus subtilis]AJE95800.1 hypothetical protein RP72_16760 [Bacillus subtilis subsp. subtilis]AKC48678.1 hypothetical protein O7A_16870 [Bacillus subtilis KCTC 1028 = ATCC 6051a]AMK73498.1 hypothetical protein AWV81_15900 [Bacillus subtilis subsp. natto]EXF55510.1 hypothetical protein Y647_05300 [Bacillu
MLQNNLKKVVDKKEAECYISKAASLRSNEMIFEN